MKSPIFLAMLLLLVGCGRAAPEARVGRPAIRRIARQCEVGAVEEVLHAGPYTYIRYQRPDETSRWLVSLQTDPAPGTTVGFVRYGEQTDFVSRRLDRSFSLLYFGFIGRCSSPEVTP